MSEEKFVDHDFALNVIQRLPFFKEFTHIEKVKLSQYYKRLSIIEADSYIIKEGEYSKSFYIILSGKVMITKGNGKLPIARLGAGEFFGEISFITNSNRTANVIAIEETIVIKVSHTVLEEMGAAMREKIKDQIILKLINRLNSMNNAFRTLS